MKLDTELVSLRTFRKHEEGEREHEALERGESAIN